MADTPTPTVLLPEAEVARIVADLAREIAPVTDDDTVAATAEAAPAPAEVELRPALLPDPATVLDMQPIDAVPVAIDS